MHRTLVLGVTLAVASIATTSSTGSAASGGPCAPAGQLACSTLATAADGTSVLRVYAPAKVAITAFDIQTGTKTTAVRPASICRKHSTFDGSQYQEGTVYVTHCTETIKPGRSRIYCFAGGGPIPSTTSASSYPVYVDAGDAGADNAKPSTSTSRCPASVAKRKRSTHHG